MSIQGQRSDALVQKYETSEPLSKIMCAKSILIFSYFNFEINILFIRKQNSIIVINRFKLCFIIGHRVSRGVIGNVPVMQLSHF